MQRKIKREKNSVSEQNPVERKNYTIGLRSICEEKLRECVMTTNLSYKKKEKKRKKKNNNNQSTFNSQNKKRKSIYLRDAILRNNSLHHKYDTLKRVFGILVNLHISTGILIRIARAILVKIHVEICQFTRIPMTRFKVSCLCCREFFGQYTLRKLYFYFVSN